MTESRKGALSRAVSSNLFLALVLLLAAGLRLGHILALRRLPLFDVLIVDSWMYDDWARRIAGGDWLGGTRAFYQDPLYPYFLAVLYRLFGHDLLLVRLVQAALGVATCALVAVMGRRVAGRAAGNLAALLLAFYLPAIFQEGEVEKTSLGVFLVTLSLALAMRPELPARMGSGLALGLAVLTRGNLILFIPPAVLYFMAAGRESPGSGPEAAAPWVRRLAGFFGRRSLEGAAGFLLGVALVFAPVAWRNHRVSGEWILTTSQAGQVFYTGNNPDNRTGGFVTPKFVRAHPLYEAEDFQAAAEAAVGRRLGPREASAYWFRQALRHIAAHPRFAATVMLRKAALFLSNYEIPDAWDIHFLARYSPVLALPLPGMALLLPLALLGAAVGFRSSREVRLLAGFVCLYGISVVMFFVFSRYRLHAVPAMAVLAACAVPWIGRVARERDLRRAVLAALLVAGGALLSLRVIDPRPYAAVNQVQSRINLASTYEAKGDPVSAERILVEAQMIAPDMADATCQLGRLRFDQGRLGEAERDLRRCVEMNFRYPEGWLMIGRLNQRTGNLDAAIAAYRTQLQLLPGSVEAEVGLAESFIAKGSFEPVAGRLGNLAGRSGLDPLLARLAAVALRATGRGDELHSLLDRAAAAGHPISEEDLDRELQRLTGAKKPS